MPSRQRAIRRQRRVQTEHIALVEQRLQADVIAALGCLSRRVANQHAPTQRTHDLDQPATDLAGTDHAVSPLRQLDALALSQGQ